MSLALGKAVHRLAEPTAFSLMLGLSIGATGVISLQVLISAVALACIIWRGRSPEFAFLRLFTGLTIFGALVRLPWPTPVVLATPLSLYLVNRLTPSQTSVRRSFGGQFRRPVASAALVIALIGLIGPIATMIARAQLDDARPPFFDVERPHPLIIVLLIGAISMVNASAEEFVWRGVLWQSLTNRPSAAARASIPSREVFASLVTSTSFGASHFATGIPNGISGALGAFAFGLLLAALRTTSGNWACGLVVHAAVDVCLGVEYLDHIVFRA